MIGKTRWVEMSDTQKEIVKATCDQTMLQTYADGESRNAATIKQIAEKGVQVHYWSKEFLAAFRKAREEVAVEQSAESPEFEKAWDSLSAFRAEYKIWKDNAYLEE